QAAQPAHAKPAGRKGRSPREEEPPIDVKDKTCVDECPVAFIYEGGRMLYIHPDECVESGACEPVCPVEAIFYENDVPDQWAQFTHRERQVRRPARLPRRRREN